MDRRTKIKISSNFWTIFTRRIVVVVLATSLATSLSACGKNASNSKALESPSGGDFASAPPIEDLPVGTDPTMSPSKAEVAPIWENEINNQKEAKRWTAHSFALVESFGTQLLRCASDIKAFCPSYFTMTSNQKVNFWVYLVSALAKFESGFDLLSRRPDPEEDDSVTKQKKWREGLLQLSYQDVKTYAFCGEEISWGADQGLAAEDPRRTILDPYRSLACGIRILDDQIGKTDLIATRGLWKTLLPNGKSVALLRALTNGLKFCR